MTEEKKKTQKVNLKGEKQDFTFFFSRKSTMQKDKSSALAHSVTQDWRVSAMEGSEQYMMSLC